ncbi:PEPxxWA-CTERM sorting domain-containing protein [Sphingomonas sp.]|uniref:PEPxxWA-CTERM sorting domain-containing protein n=1 Tax=Sphingomonas sp. TaxID=28214 RepID=UPI003CC578BB
MTTLIRLLAAGSMVAMAAIAAPASAQSYNLNFGAVLNGQITTVPSTGTNKAITSVTGSFMGSAITGIIANPYSPATANFTPGTGLTTPVPPVATTGTVYYYSYDNLLLANNLLDSGGLLFTTSTTIANLYYDSGAFAVAYSPIGQNVAGDVLPLTGSITAVPAVGAVPEPASWAMMIAGFGLAGFALRRRQKVVTRVTYA